MGTLTIGEKLKRLTDSQDEMLNEITFMINTLKIGQIASVGKHLGDENYCQSVDKVAKGIKIMAKNIEEVNEIRKKLIKELK